MPSAWELHSAIPGEMWPALPAANAAIRLALQLQLERAQWLSADRLRELQLRQLDPLLRHAYATVPCYRERWHGLYDPNQTLTMDGFQRLPIFTRGELQKHAAALRSTEIPAAHGSVSEGRTAGSTGEPVCVLKTALNELLWQSVLLREHDWFARDLRGTLASILQGVKTDIVQGWGHATDEIAVTGRSATLPVKTDVDTQMAWLEELQPDYLLSYPSNIAQLAKRSIARGVRFPSLREVRTFGERLSPETRELCRQAWALPVTDAYLTTEAGYLALQCPRHEQYHVQSETVLLEVLDDHGKPCAPGSVGRVIVTVLHNFAMPLVRYDMGDWAEVGAACPCGRGLPVLRRIAGRGREYAGSPAIRV